MAFFPVPIYLFIIIKYLLQLIIPIIVIYIFRWRRVGKGENTEVKKNRFFCQDMSETYLFTSPYSELSNRYLCNNVIAINIKLHA